jgi:hypothetical protein
MTESAPAVRYQLTLDDFREMTAHLCGKVRPRSNPLLLVIVMIFVFVLIYNLVSSGPGGEAFAGGMLVGMTFPLAFFWLRLRAGRAAERKLEPRAGGPVLSSYACSIGEDALLLETPFERSSMAWPAFVGLDESQGLLLLRIDNNAAYAVPKRAFADPEQLRRFREEIGRRIGNPT